MGPEKLLGITSDDVFDRFDEAAGIFLDIGGGIGTALDLNLVLNNYAMGPIVGLAHDEYRDHRRAGDLHQPGEPARSRRHLPKERHEDRLAALGILVKRDAHQLVRTQGPQHRARRGVFTYGIHADPLSDRTYERVAGQKPLGVMDQANLMAMQGVTRGQQFEIAEVRG